MTTTAAIEGQGAVTPTSDRVTLTVDGIEVTVPVGTVVIRAAEQLGITIPRFCDHPLLAPVAVCRQCLVEVALPGADGVAQPMPKPAPACATVVSEGMSVKTQLTSAVAEAAQRGVLEFLLINHSLDCPTCDKGGECLLQDQVMSGGNGTSRFHETKRRFVKPIAISTEILLDRERCVLCQRCTRFADEIAGDRFIDLLERGTREQIGGFDASGRPFSSYFAGNTVQICPVGALTSSAYRFRARPFDLTSLPGVAEHDSNGAAVRVESRRGVVVRRLACDDPDIGQEWLTDKDRFAFTWQSMPDRITTPLVRDVADDGTRGELRPATWEEAFDRAAAGLSAARAARGVGVLPGGRLTIEDAYTYAKFARVALGTNDIDHRARPSSDEEAAFLGHCVAGAPMSVTLADLSTAPAVLLVGFEPEDEGGIVFLRLREGVRAGRTRVFSIAPYASRALTRLDATLLPAAPGTEAEVLDAIRARAQGPLGAAGVALVDKAAIIVVGERLASAGGGFTAALRFARRTRARLAWIPRRIGERAGVEAGTLPGLLPGGRPVDDPAAHTDMTARWNVEQLPSRHGRDTGRILAAAADGSLGALLVGGVDPGDLPDPAAALKAIARVGFVVSLEVRRSAVTALADVVFPVAPPAERAGTYLNWEGRLRPFAQTLTSTAMADHRVLDALAGHMEVALGLGTLTQVHNDMTAVGTWHGERCVAPDVPPHEPLAVGPGQALLATWHLLLDAGRCQDGEPFLEGAAQRAVARLSPAMVADLGIATGDEVTVSTRTGRITVPVVETDMPDGVVWVPTCSAGSRVRGALRADAGDVVEVSVPHVARTVDEGEVL